MSEFKQFLLDKIKINGKVGNLGGKIKITNDKDKIYVLAEIPFDKKYLKYLTKKYIKKKDLQPFLAVKATSKNTYKMKYLSTFESTFEPTFIKSGKVYKNNNLQ
jgi:large subunit ribosomal protein L22e